MNLPRRNILTGLLFVLVLYGLLGHVLYSDAGEISYYDNSGNLISREKYLELIGQQEKTIQKKQVPAAKETAEAGEVSIAGEEPKTKSPSLKALPDAAGPSKDKTASSEDKADEPQYQVSISSGTLFRALQRNIAKKDDAPVTPAYEYLRVDFGTLDQSGLSLHMYGWGRYDFSDSGFYKENPDGEVLYGYIEYARPDYGFNFKLGRQHFFEGVINNSIDGLGIKSALTPYFGLSLYGGFPVELKSEDGRSGDSFLGGRLSTHLSPKYEIGLSYKQKYSQGDEDEKIAGVDLFVSLPGNGVLQGLSAYNLETRGWGEHTYEAGFDIADFHLRPLYQRYQYKDFFNTGGNSADPFRFLSGTGEILTIAGGEVIWSGLSVLDLGAKVNYYTYDLRKEDALYYEGDLTWYLNGRTQIGGQLGRMDGESAETRYLLSRLFFYWHAPFGLVPLGFITGDVVYVHYDEELFGKNQSLFFSLGGGSRFFNDALEVRLSGDYSQDPFFRSDLRGLLVVTFKY